MDYFGRENLRELLEETEGPAVSIYLQTHRTSSEAEQDRLRFRASLDRAGELLAGDYGDKLSGSLLEEFEPLTREQEFWRYQSDGLAVFKSPRLARMYRLPTSLSDIVVVGSSFHTRPLIELLQAPDRYWVLGVGQKKVRLWEGTAAGLAPLDLKQLPGSLLEALDYEVMRDHEVVHRGKPMEKRTSWGRGQYTPAFHGHGIGVDDTDAEQRQFYRKVDRALQGFLRDEIGPLVLGAVGKTHPLYRSVSKLENLAEEGVDASVVDWNLDRLHEAAWPIAKRTVLRKLDRALELWESGYGRGKGEPDLANLGRLAVAGRIRLLLTERGRRFWGHVDRRTGKLEIVREGGEDPGNQAVDVLNELAELVLLHGGRALVLSPERMPTETGVAGVLR